MAARKRTKKKPALGKPFATAQVCPLGLDMWGTFPDGSMYLFSLSWAEVASLAKKRGKRIAGKGGIERLTEKLGPMLKLKQRPDLACAQRVAELGLQKEMP